MIGIKKKIMGPMAGLILLIGITACENELGSRHHNRKKNR